MKKFLAFFLTLAMLTSCLTVAFAESESEIPTEPEFGTEISVDDEEIPDEGEQTVDETADENTGDDEVADNNEIVATISLCSNIYVWPISGHTWIYVHNNSDEPIKVGLYEVLPDQGMSVGVLSFSVIDGWGIYYNRECYKENIKGRADNARSISEGINAEQLETLSRTLINYPNYWGFGNNCATFAFTLWNSVTGDAYFSLLIPGITDFMIMCGGGKRGVLDMYQPPRDQVLRQVGYGDDAYLRPVNDISAG